MAFSCAAHFSHVFWIFAGRHEAVFRRLHNRARIEMERAYRNGARSIVTGRVRLPGVHGARIEVERASVPIGALMRHRWASARSERLHVAMAHGTRLAKCAASCLMRGSRRQCCCGRQGHVESSSCFSLEDQW